MENWIQEAQGVIGVGTDIVEVERIERALERHGERFMKRVFTQEEVDYCTGMARPGPHFAARFAAKEAVSKCFGTGIGAEFGWTSLSVRKGARGEPFAVLDEQGNALLQRVGGSAVLISLSHTKTLATAFAVIVK